MEKEYCSIFNPYKLDECIICEKGYYYFDDNMLKIMEIITIITKIV